MRGCFSPRSFALVFGGLALWLGLAAPAAGEPLTLRVNDTSGEPGGLVAAVLRTYAPRAVGQGQICFEARARFNGPLGASQPLATLEEVVVFSATGDAQSSGTFDPGAQEGMVSFSSLSDTINTVDGPLAVLYFRLSADLQPGETFDLVINHLDTFLLDDADQPIALELRAGELTVIAPGDPRELGAAGDEVTPGGLVHLAVETSSLFAISSGQVVFRYDPAIAVGDPVVTMDPRYGQATFSVNTSISGLVMISFDSPDDSLNEVPGSFIGITLRTASSAPVGTTSRVYLDDALTFLLGPGSNPISLLFEEDVIEFVPPDFVFIDGFESGSLSGWSGAVTQIP